MAGTGSGERWSIVLAGGDGKRCEAYCTSLYGDGRPKQFCALTGQKSQIEETLDRVRLFSAPQKTVLSVCRNHLAWRGLWESAGRPRVSIQPTNADTGPAVLAGTLLIDEKAPDATIALFPSDHYVSDTLRFVAPVREAAIWLERHPDAIILLAARATGPETEYGWLLPREALARPGYGPQPARLIEKPDLEHAKRLVARGASWNTSVVVYRSRVLLRLMEVFAPEWWRALAGGVTFGGEGLDEAYSTLPPFNLSRDVLQHSPHHLWMMPLQGVRWSDLGNEERIRAQLACGNESGGSGHRTTRTEHGARGARPPVETFHS